MYGVLRAAANMHAHAAQGITSDTPQHPSCS